MKYFDTGLCITATKASILCEVAVKSFWRHALNIVSHKFILPYKTKKFVYKTNLFITQLFNNKCKVYI